jgi:hypothetical protein
MATITSVEELRAATPPGVRLVPNLERRSTSQLPGRVTRRCMEEVAGILATCEDDDLLPLLDAVAASGQVNFARMTLKALAGRRPLSVAAGLQASAAVSIVAFVGEYLKVASDPHPFLSGMGLQYLDLYLHRYSRGMWARRIRALLRSLASSNVETETREFAREILSSQRGKRGA